ncbi:CHC2 zinc finger domain-containing protein [Candidatus Nardonella dryophthoridicola]|uniref:CHC2 zinc finger domain-containing protein n=1 Tax=endosymbiont of Metamasius hemipterus TaxID=204627 RepID=A0ABT0TX40_9GAMM|nr:CHC2 zinc finger domain-containing protein [Candidatus Nardonella dryophthoridicola]MCM0158278.1 CHC2 zinc finger domain-containing protein [endosymbiont of Metamasius hemipterus]
MIYKNSLYNINDINYILEKINILDYIKKKLYIKKIGNNFFALCPFHNEKHPSFIISEKLNKYYCFGCKTYGNIINFIIYYEKTNFYNAIKIIEQFYNVNINKKIYINDNNIILYKYNYIISKIYNNNLINNINNIIINNFLNLKK